MTEPDQAGSDAAVDAGTPVAAVVDRQEDDSEGVATGDPRVDAAVARLDELAEAPTGEHVAVYEDVHRRLHDALADLAADG